MKIAHRMKAEIKSMWVAALRGGEYLKGTGSLKISDSGPTPCCCPLGVLCDLYIKETGRGSWVVRNEWNDYSFHGGLDKSRSVSFFPPQEVLDWAGLSCLDPDILDDDEAVREVDEINGTEITLFNRSLTAANDKLDLSFEEIAARIDVNL
jgi:hypothetical protein